MPQRIIPKNWWYIEKSLPLKKTADTLHAHVPVARIGKSSKQSDCLRFYTKQVVFISKHLVFYSAQIPVKINGYAKNWDSTGHWEEIYQPQSKYRVKLLQTVSRFHQDNVTINDHIYMYINARFNGIFTHFVHFICPLKRNWIKSSKTIQYFSYFSLHNYMKTIQTLTRILSAIILNWNSPLYKGWRLCLAQ